MRDAVIVGAVRTPVGRRGGALAGIHPVELSAHVLCALAQRSGLDPGEVDDVLWGCVSQVGEQGANLARNAVLAAGFPDAVTGTTVNRFCGSGLQSVHFAAMGVGSGASEGAGRSTLTPASVIRPGSAWTSSVQPVPSLTV